MGQYGKKGSGGGGGGNQNLSQVLTVGNNATQQDIINVDELRVDVITDNPGVQGLLIDNSGAGFLWAINIKASLQALNLEGSTIRLDSDAGGLTNEVVIGTNMLTTALSLVNGTELRVSSSSKLAFPGSGAFDNYFKEVSATQIGVYVGAGEVAKFDQGGFLIDNIYELNAGLGIRLQNNTGINTAPSANTCLRLKPTDIPDFADNAAALIGGLSLGDVYRTSTLGTSILKMVE